MTIAKLKGRGRTIVVVWYFYEHVYENMHPRKLEI